MLFAIAVNDSFAYQFVLFLHVLAAIIGFGSTFVWPMLAAKSRALAPTEALAVNRLVVGSAKVLSSPFTIATGIFGAILIVLSDDFYDFSQPWVSLSLTLWLVGAALALGVHGPNLNAMVRLQEEMVAAGPPQGGPPPQAEELAQRGKKAQAVGGVLHLLFAVLLVAMVFLPEAAT